MKSHCTAYNATQSYERPSIEVVAARVELGFGQSYSQQEPSPWEDM